jgi:hypothetical protein
MFIAAIFSRLHRKERAKHGVTDAATTKVIPALS